MIDNILNGRWPRHLLRQPWLIIGLVIAIAGFGIAILYSAAAGSFEPWAGRQAIRFGLLFGWMLLLSMAPLRFWVLAAWPIYLLTLVALVAVELLGAISGGAQRWLDLGIIRLQPSELMKIAIVLVIARIYHYMPRGACATLPGIWPPLLVTILPMALVLLQPDLGTAITLLAGGVTMMFLGGLPWRYLLGPAALGTAMVPLLYSQLQDYQKRRVATFLNPEDDPLGAGYHITQSKIAIGSGGLDGKGFLNGSQSHLDYLPTPHTDFAFATMAEEWGVVGGMALIASFVLLLNWAIRIAIQSQTIFARLVAAGLSMTLFFYVLINLMMVMGMAPVVGIPLPLISYGGSSMLTIMTAIGILIGVWRARDQRIL